MSSCIKYCSYILFIIGLVPVTAQISFKEKAFTSGINHIYTFGQAGGGVSFVDFNGDGLDDLTLGTAKGELIHFYINTGSGFERFPPLNGNNSEHKQILWADYDNDGDKDLFVCAKGDVNRLYQNNGNMSFSDITSSSHLPFHEFDTFNACWADFNRDGWLDLYVCERMPGNQQANRNYLFFNNADGTFKDGSEESNALAAAKLPFCSSALDYNKDKWPDIYIANDRNWGNVLLQNMGNGIFEDVSIITNSDYAIDAMSVALGDYNNDSWTDIYVTNTPAGNLLLKNENVSDGINIFNNVADSVGVSFNGTAWGANFIDGDNDMDLDIYVSGADFGSDGISAAFYEQINSDSFQIINEGFNGDTVISYANAIGDFNNDGYYDIAVLNYNDNRSFLFENQTIGNNFLKIHLEGVLSNKDAIGASIEIFVDSINQYYYTHSGVGFQAQNSENYIFGLDTFPKADSILILWPTGHIDKLFNVNAGQSLVILEGSSTNGEINIDEDITIKPSDFPSLIHENNLPKVSIDIFPNPTNNHINIFSENIIEEVVLSNFYGVQIDKFKPKSFFHSIRLDEKNLSQGLYLIKIELDDGMKIVKTIIID